MAFLQKVSEKAVATRLILTAFTLFGLTCKLLIEIKEPLNSDNIATGLMSMEIWRHKNYLLNSYYQDASHPGFFPDLVPLNFLPQVLSSFDPDWIRWINFSIYLGSVAVLAIAAYRASGEINAGLAASALMANMYPSSFGFYTLLTAHGTSLIAAGLLMLNIRRLVRMKPWMLLVLGVVINAMVFSDSILLAWFIIPYLAVSFLLSYDLRSRAYSVLLAISGFITHYWKTNLITDFVSVPPALRDMSSVMTESLPMLIKGLSYLLNGSLYALFNGPGIWDLVVASAFILALFYSMRSAIADREPGSRDLFAFLATSTVVIFASFILTTLSVNFLTTRYLIMAAASAYLIMAVALKNRSIPYLLLILILLSAGAHANYSFLKESSQPNQSEMELIDLLRSKGLNYGYGDYWDANLVTYLTNEEIVMRPVSVYRGELQPFRWVTCERWFSEAPEKIDKYFIVTRVAIRAPSQEEENPWEMMPLLRGSDLGPVFDLKEPVETIDLRDHRVYVFQGPVPYLQMNGWYAPENWSGSKWRWMSRDARLTIPSADNRSEVLRLKATSFLEPRTLEIGLEGSVPIRTEVTTGFSSIEAPLNLTRGDNTVTLHVIDGCDKPCETTGPRKGDSRCLSLAVENITA